MFRHRSQVERLTPTIDGECMRVADFSDVEVSLIRLVLIEALSESEKTVSEAICSVQEASRSNGPRKDLVRPMTVRQDSIGL